MVDLPNGTTMWFAYRFSVVKKGDNFDEMMLIASDVTQRKKTEAQLEKANNKIIKTARIAGMGPVDSYSIYSRIG